jgi:hypothetical protein
LLKKKEIRILSQTENCCQWPGHKVRPYKKLKSKKGWGHGSSDKAWLASAKH